MTEVYFATDDIWQKKKMRSSGSGQFSVSFRYYVHTDNGNIAGHVVVQAGKLLWAGGGACALAHL